MFAIALVFVDHLNVELPVKSHVTGNDLTNVGLHLIRNTHAHTDIHAQTHMHAHMHMHRPRPRPRRTIFHKYKQTQSADRTVSSFAESSAQHRGNEAGPGSNEK